MTNLDANASTLMNRNGPNFEGFRTCLDFAKFQGGDNPRFEPIAVTRVAAPSGSTEGSYWSFAISKYDCGRFVGQISSSIPGVGALIEDISSYAYTSVETGVVTVSASSAVDAPCRLLGFNFQTDWIISCGVLSSAQVRYRPVEFTYVSVSSSNACAGATAPDSFREDVASDLDFLRASFRMPDAKGIESFLQQNEFLIPILLESRESLTDRFPQPVFVLDIMQDPDDLEFEELVLNVISTLPPDQACEALRQFDEEWWLDNVDRSEGKLCITVGFD